MIKEVKCYSLMCDNCHKGYIESGSDYCVWLEESIAIESATENDWIEHEGKHYCPNCYEVDEDDNITIKEREVEND